MLNNQKNNNKQNKIRKMGFSESIKSGLNNSFNPIGRATRSQFWWYALFLYIIGGVLGWFGGMIEGHGMEQVWLGIIFQVFSLICLISLICASIRRLHDTGKSGWNVLWYILPLIGWIVEIVLLCGASQPGDNKYGPQPR